MKAREVILEEMDDIARLISGGSRQAIRRSDFDRDCAGARFNAVFRTQRRSMLKPEKINIGQLALMGRSSKIVYQPLGVVAIISPWNYRWRFRSAKSRWL
jgi:acyl-CoA reductase-like NAD-dependent aldehyde dehydrogenase